MAQHKIVFISALGICTIFMLVLYYYHSRYWRHKIYNTLSMCYFMNIISLISDIFWMLVDGIKEYSALNYILNIVECSSLVMLGYFWFFYSSSKSKFDKWKTTFARLVAFIPAGFCIIVIALSPWIGKVFYLDENYCYQRGPWFFLQYTAYGYLIVSSLLALLSIKKTNFTMEKEHYRIIAIFALPSVLLGFIQVLFEPGVLPTLQFAIYLSCFCIFVNEQKQKITIDSLTRLNNRYQFEQILNERIKKYKSNGDKKLYVIAGDIDNFKKINDEFGHLEGDNAICIVGKVLDEISLTHDAVACRRSGDEFLGLLESERVTPEKLIEIVNNKLDRETCDKPYTLALSYGIVKYDGRQSLQELVNTADYRMYLNKKERLSFKEKKQ